MTSASPSEHSVLQRIRGSLRTSTDRAWHQAQFHALGTPCRIQFVAPEPAPVVRTVLEWVARFEATYSRFLPTSLISRINAAAGREPVPIDPETERILTLCHELHRMTQGLFDPTALPLIQLWDWRSGAIPIDAAIDAARRKVGWTRVARESGKVFLPEPGMALDLGGMGKEFAVDEVALLAADLGATSVLVDFGQDVRVQGPPPENKPAWHIGLEDPLQPGRCWTGLAALNQSVATSGDYLRSFGHDGRRYGHILDLRTGRPVANGCRAVSVIAPSCSLAGMLSTAAFVLGATEGIRLIDGMYQAAGCVVTETGRVPSRRFHEFATR